MILMKKRLNLKYSDIFIALQSLILESLVWKSELGICLGLENVLLRVYVS